MGDVTLGALSDAGAIAIGDGYRTRRAEHGQPGYRILRVADVLDGRVCLDGDDFVRQDFARTIGPKLSQSDDVLLTTKGTVGRAAIYPSGVEQVVYSPQLCYFRVIDRTVLTPHYLAYWFKSGAFRQQAANRSNNTDMAAYINLRDIRSLMLELPPIEEQRAIAEVLGALDDKIAANDCLARTAARLTDARFIAAVRGVPMGDQTFGDLADVGGGGTPKTSVAEYWNGEIPWATPTDVTALDGLYLAATSRTISEEGLGACSSRLYPENSILMTSRATIGEFALASMPVAANQGFIVVNAHKESHQFWLFHEMRHRIKEFISHANGATFLELSRGKFKQFRVRAAKDVQAEAFAADVGPLHVRAAQAYEENRVLARTRDELLPLLMSGKVRVRDAEKVVEGAV